MIVIIGLNKSYYIVALCYVALASPPRHQHVATWRFHYIHYIISDWLKTCSRVHGIMIYRKRTYSTGSRRIILQEVTNNLHEVLKRWNEIFLVKVTRR